jgi:sugar phosphate isomerase/epimerase
MKLGFLTAAFPDLTLGEVASWAASEVNAHLLKVVDAAQALGVRVVGTFAGNDQTKRRPTTWSLSASSGRPSLRTQRSAASRSLSRTAR